MASLYLVTPLSGRPGQQYLLAGILIVSGVGLSLLTMLMTRRLGSREAGITDAAQLAEAPD